MRSTGRRAARGPLWARHRSAQGGTARFAFAVPRTVGNAVTRNRVRRRIKAILHDLDRSAGKVPGPGDYLLGVTCDLAHLSYTELRVTLAALLAELADEAGS